MTVPMSRRLRERAAFTLDKKDLRAEAARSVIGTGKLLGVSTHNLDQFNDAAARSADYVAAGPVFSTSTKANPDPVVGIELFAGFAADDNRSSPSVDHAGPRG